MKNKRWLKLLAKISENAAKRADGRASEFGIYQPQKPKRHQEQ